jgi:VIT1/CCC1 family predicted Fe2+/Mn2+ transporter
MKSFAWIKEPRDRLDIVAGLIDGILSALTLAAGKLVSAHGGLALTTVGKVAVVTVCSTSFVFFVAHYSQLRTELVRAERELNLLSHGKFAASRLGRQVLRESVRGAVVASCCALIGSTLPLAVGLLVPQVPVFGLILSVVLLGVLGWVLGTSVFGSPVVWAVALVVGGIVVTLIGAQLDIIG